MNIGVNRFRLLFLSLFCIVSMDASLSQETTLEKYNSLAIRVNNTLNSLFSPDQTPSDLAVSTEQLQNRSDIEKTIKTANTLFVLLANRTSEIVAATEARKKEFRSFSNQYLTRCHDIAFKEQGDGSFNFGEHANLFLPSEVVETINKVVKTKIFGLSDCLDVGVIPTHLEYGISQLNKKYQDRSGKICFFDPFSPNEVYKKQFVLDEVVINGIIQEFENKGQLRDKFEQNKQAKLKKAYAIVYADIKQKLLSRKALYITLLLGVIGFGVKYRHSIQSYFKK